MKDQEDFGRHLHAGAFEAEEGKARWSPPHLTKHGTVAELTAQAGSPIAGLTVLITPVLLTSVTT